MKRALVLVVTTFVVAASSASASARTLFGEGESLRHIEYVNLRGPSGEELYLGRKVLFQNFVLPYSVSDGGYVLGVVGNSRAYYPLPNPEKLKVLQSRGQLPNPLPPWELSFYDKFIGRWSWLLFCVIFAYLVKTHLRSD